MVMMGIGELRDLKVMFWIEFEEVLIICILFSLGVLGVEIIVIGFEMVVFMVLIFEVRVLWKLILVVVGDVLVLMFI